MEYTDADEECLLEKRPQPHNAEREGADSKDRFFAVCFAANLGFVAALAVRWRFFFLLVGCDGIFWLIALTLAA